MMTVSVSVSLFFCCGWAPTAHRPMCNREIVTCRVPGEGHAGTRFLVGHFCD